MEAAIEDETSGLLLIGGFKLIKSAALTVVAVCALVFGHVPHALERVVEWIGGGHLSVHDVHLLGWGGLAYAIVLLVEGVGLLYRKRWAEFLTLAVTSALIPFEVYRLAAAPSFGRVMALAINIAVVLYLVWLLRRQKSRRAGRSGL